MGAGGGVYTEINAERIWNSMSIPYCTTPIGKENSQREYWHWSSELI